MSFVSFLRVLFVTSPLKQLMGSQNNTKRRQEEDKEKISLNIYPEAWTI